MTDPYRRTQPSRLAALHYSYPEVQVTRRLWAALKLGTAADLDDWDLDGIEVRQVDDLPADLEHLVVWPNCSCVDCVLEHSLRQLARA